jgi:PKD domain
MRRRPALAASLALVTPLLLAAPARADFCVGPSPPCFDNLQGAIDAAAVSPGTDTITVAPGTFAGGATTTTNPVNIIGAGPLQTTLTLANPGDPTVLELAASGSSASSLHITVPTLKRGLELTDSVGADLLVDSPEGTHSQRGVNLNHGGTLERSTIALPVPPGPQGNLGLETRNTGDPLPPGAMASDVTISAENAIAVSDDTSLTLRSSRVTAQQGINLISGAPAGTVVDDVLFAVLPPDSASSYVADAENTSEAQLTLRNVTARGSGVSTVGAQAFDGARIHIASSTFSNFATDLAPGTGSIDASYSSFSSVVPGTGNIAGDPGFLDAAVGDFRLPFSSPLVDAGDPGPLLGPATDLAGAPRLVNGRVDIGAFEYQRRPPVPSIAVSQGSPKTGDPVGFDGSGSTDPDPGDSPPSFAWTFDDGGVASGPSVAHVFTTAGTHTATLTVTDPAGASASLSRSVEIGSKDVGVLPPVPSLSSFTATRGRFAVKRGTSFRYTLSSAARSTRISIDALLPGKRSGRSCVKPTKKLARAKGCTRTVATGGISGPAAAGRNTLAWDGRLNRKALAPGRYKATARATDRFGRLSNTKTLTFTIVASR